ISLDQENMKLQLDLVRSSGNGQVKYQYRLEQQAAWETLSGNELLLTSLRPGRSSLLSLRISDRVWKSDQVNIHLYVVPYWWQTITAGRILWAAALLIFACLV